MHARCAKLNYPRRWQSRFSPAFVCLSASQFIRMTSKKSLQLVSPYLTIQHNTKRIYNASINASKKRTQRREWRLLLWVTKKFAFKVMYKTIHTSCITAVKRQVIPDLWNTNSKCFARTAKQLFVRRSQWTRWRIVTNVTDTMDFHSVSPCKSKRQACSRCVVSPVTNAVSGAVL